MKRGTEIVNWQIFSVEGSILKLDILLILIRVVHLQYTIFRGEGAWCLHIKEKNLNENLWHRPKIQFFEWLQLWIASYLLFIGNSIFELVCRWIEVQIITLIFNILLDILNTWKYWLKIFLCYIIQTYNKTRSYLRILSNDFL